MSSRAKPRSKARWTFSSTRDLVTWMQEEYLSEIALDDMDPMPAHDEEQPPADVCFTWWLRGGGRRVPYRVTARGVRRWFLDGELGDGAVSIPPPNDPAPGVHLVMEVLPGRLLLECASVVVARGRAERTIERRPFVDYAYFTVSGAGDLTAAELLEYLGAPPGAKVVAGGSGTLSTLPTQGSMDIEVGGVTWVRVFRAARPGEPGYWMSVSRVSASDADWHRAQALPGRIQCSEVASAWEFSGTPSQWLALVNLR
jgi:hypothetical protein